MPRSVGGSQSASFSSNAGAGYGRASGRFFRQRQAGGVFPYVEITDLEDEELEFDDEYISGRNGRHKKIDHPASSRDPVRGRTGGGFVTGATRGISDAKNLGDCLISEILAGARGSASPSFNVSGADGTTRTRPGRRTGSTRGWAASPVPKKDDRNDPAYTLKDIGDREDDPLIIADKDHEEAVEALEGFIRNIIGEGKKIKWDEQPLEQVIDAEIARDLGVTSVSVFTARKKRGIPAFKK